MVRAPATKVNVMSFFRLTLVAPTADIVAFPFQVPANAAGIVAPVGSGGDDVGGVGRGAVAGGPLAWPAGGVPPEPAGEAGGDPWVSSRPARTISAAAAAPQAARISVRRDRAGIRPGPEIPVGWPLGNVGPAGGYCGPVCGTESAPPSTGAIGPAALPCAGTT